jgi:hypothetical protein
VNPTQTTSANDENQASSSSGTGQPNSSQGSSEVATKYYDVPAEIPALLTPVADDGSGIYALGISMYEFTRALAISTPMVPLGWQTKLESGGIDIVSIRLFCQDSEANGGAYFFAGWYYFDSNGKLIAMLSMDSCVQTSKGLKVGDSVDTLKVLYGEPDEIGGDAEWGYLFEYNLSKDVHLTVLVDGNKERVYKWRISDNGKGLEAWS